MCFLSFSSRPPLKLSFSFLAPVGTKSTRNPFFFPLLPTQTGPFFEPRRKRREESPEDIFPRKGRFGTLGWVPLSNREEESNKFCPFPPSPPPVRKPPLAGRKTQERERERQREEERGGGRRRKEGPSLGFPSKVPPRPQQGKEEGETVGENLERFPIFEHGFFAVLFIEGRAKTLWCEEERYSVDCAITFPSYFFVCASAYSKKKTRHKRDSKKCGGVSSNK